MCRCGWTTRVDHPKDLSMKTEPTAERDARETELAVRAKAGDAEATRLLFAAAEPVIRMAVQRHLNGCVNFDAAAEATAACKTAFMESIDRFEADRGTSIRTLWYYGFRRAVVGYVRTTARRTTREFSRDNNHHSGPPEEHRTVARRFEKAPGAHGEDPHLIDPADNPAEVAEIADDARDAKEQAKRVEELLAAAGDTADTQAFRAWVAAGYNFIRAAKTLGGISPRTVENRVSKVRAMLRGAIRRG